MTERGPEERRPSRLNEDEAEVEGHVFKYGPEDVPAEAERRPSRLNEDDEADGEERHPPC